MYVSAVLAVVLVLHAASAHAAVTAADLNSPGYMTTAFQQFVARMNTAVNAALAPGTVWIKWARGLLLGAFAIKIIETLFRYTFGKAGIGDMAETLSVGAIITALYTTYSSWTFLLFMTGFEAGRLIQGILIQDSGIMGPSLYVAKVFANFKLSNSSFFSLGVIEAIESAIFLIFEVLLTCASFFASIWPSLVYAVAKLVGPIFFSTLFHERISFLFDGWLRFFLGCALYGLLGRACLCVVCILFQAMFGIPYGQNAASTAILLTTDNFGAFLFICTASFISLLLLFSTAAFTARLVGGGDISIGKAIGSVARTVGTALAAFA